jgi:hypothetical protein
MDSFTTYKSLQTVQTNPTTSPANGNFYFRVTLVWNGSGDLDLHTWDPNQAHSSWQNREIGTGELDVDNIVANGPENFSCRNLSLGRYRIAVNAYSTEFVRQAFVRVSVNYGVNAGKSWVFGPYTFTQYNHNSGYPISSNNTCWWRPCDIVVFGNDIHPVNADSYYLDKGKEAPNKASCKK